MRLSGGERQRISLARAFLNAPISSTSPLVRSIREPKPRSWKQWNAHARSHHLYDRPSPQHVGELQHAAGDRKRKTRYCDIGRVDSYQETGSCSADATIPFMGIKPMPTALWTGSWQTSESVRTRSSWVSSRSSASSQRDPALTVGLRMASTSPSASRAGRDDCYFTNIAPPELELIGSYVVIGWNATIAELTHPVAPTERIVTRSPHPGQGSTAAGDGRPWSSRTTSGSARTPRF